MALRAIGQSLADARVRKFEIENAGENYLVLSDYLTHRLVRFTPAHISRLDARASQERNHSLPRRATVNGLSRALRSLGNQFNSADTRKFHLSWTPRSVSVDYETVAGQIEHRVFTAKELQQFDSLQPEREDRVTRANFSFIRHFS